jgi:hypothetical protein
MRKGQNWISLVEDAGQEEREGEKQSDGVLALVEREEPEKVLSVS